MNQARIMLVDDEEFVLTSLTRSLRRQGYELITFTAAREALAYLDKEEVDVIISDHRMPQMTGLDFLIESRQKHPEVIRILLTGYADMDVAIRAVNEGKLFRFLTKPWKDEELKMTIANALQLRTMLVRNRELLAQLKKQEDYIRALEVAHPGISSVKRDAKGAIIIDDG